MTDADLRVLFLQHDPGSRPGLVGEALADRGATVEVLEMAGSVHDPDWHGTFPEVGAHDLLVPLGAIWSVYDSQTLGWVAGELDWLRAADEAGVPVLGICFGGQALALAHGGTVSPMGHMDIGFTEVDTAAPSRIPSGPWMQWHGDRFVPPAGAEVLATAPTGVQAFSLRRNLGLQFHPEVTESIVRRWAALAGRHAHEAADGAGTSVDELVQAARLHRDRARRDIDTVLDWWLPGVGLG